MIPQGFVDSLTERVDLVDLVGQYVPLKKAGANFVGRCPFHQEKSPSFSVSPAKQFYHCFGCGAHGDAVRFLMEHLGLGFPQAVEMLAGRLGLEVPQERPDGRPSLTADERQAVRDRSLRLHDRLLAAARFYHRRLKGSPAVDYLKRRGITGETALKFRLGYSPEGWNGLQACFPDYNHEELVASGLVIVPENAQADEGDNSAADPSTRRRYDRFRGRLMFPILGLQGEVLGFGARTLGDEQPKYLNSPETEVFTKGAGVYGLYEAKQAIRAADEVWVVEGYMDVIALAQAGFGHVVATLGTATTEDQARLLLRQSQRLAFMFDGDKAGRKAAIKAMDQTLPLVKDGVLLRFVFLPEGEDPDSLVRQQEPDALRECVNQAQSLSEFLRQVAIEGADLRLAEGRARATLQYQKLIGRMPPSVLRAQIIRQAAADVLLEPDELEPVAPPTPSRTAAADSRQARPRQSDGPDGYFEPPQREQSGYSTQRRRPGPSGGRASVAGRAPTLEQRLLRVAARRPDLASRLSPLAKGQLSVGAAAALALLLQPSADWPAEPRTADLVERLLAQARMPNPVLDQTLQHGAASELEADWQAMEARLELRALEAEARRLADQPISTSSLAALQAVQAQIAERRGR